MWDSRDPKSCQLCELMAEYLLNCSGFFSPGMDGATIEDIVFADYRIASARGKVPAPEELAELHPDLADAIQTFFSPDVSVVNSHFPSNCRNT